MKRGRRIWLVLLGCGVIGLIAALESTGVSLAALWNFDLTGQDSSFDVAADNPRSWVLDELQRANERLQRHH